MYGEDYQTYLQKIKELIGNSQNENDYFSSVSMYATAIELSMDKKYDESIEALNKAMDYFLKSNVKDPLYRAWIFCELAYCYKSKKEFDKALLFYECGLIFLKISHFKMRHYDVIREYLQFALISEALDSQTRRVIDDKIKEFQNTAIDCKNDRYPFYLLFLAEVAILYKHKGLKYSNNQDVIRGTNIITQIYQDTLKLHTQDAFLQSVMHYVQGVMHSITGDIDKINKKEPESVKNFREALTLFKKAGRLIKNKSIDDIILLTFINREIAYCDYNLAFKKDTWTTYVTAFKNLQELDWELNLYTRTFGLFYNSIAAIRFEKFRNFGRINEGEGENVINITQKERTCNLENEIKKLTDLEIKSLNLNLKILQEPVVAYENALQYIERISDNILIATIHINLSQYYSLKGEFVRAKWELDQIETTVEKLSDELANNFIKAQFYHASAYTMRNMGQDQDALDLYKKALEFAERVHNDSILSHIYINMIPILMDEKRIDEALEYANRARNISGNIIDPEILSYLYKNIAELCMLKYNDYYNATKNIKMAMDYASKTENKILISKIKSSITWIQSMKGITCQKK